jgi:hypothetical protein
MFVVLSTFAFAICLLLSDLGTARHLLWLRGWPPLLFVLTVPSEYRFRFTGTRWAREIFQTFTAVCTTALIITVAVEATLHRVHIDAADPWRGIGEIVVLVGIGGIAFGLLSLVSAWTLYTVAYHRDGPAARGRRRPSDDRPRSD